MKILHITAHLGGGVGKALSGFTSGSTRGDEHQIVCLEHAEKEQFISQIRRTGIDVTVMPSTGKLKSMIDSADIVQVEWWNHPATVKTLCEVSGLAMRLIVWCHVSGLSTPRIPEKLLQIAHHFVFTSKCSFQAPEVKNQLPGRENRIHAASSCGGLADLPLARHEDNQSLRVGYIGSLNFAKLHPHFVQYLSAIDRSDFKIVMIGDMENQETLVKQARQIGRPDLFEFLGYVYDVPEILKSIHVLAYLLNPYHYGTTENALLEAMAMGIVPIVLDNPAEKEIVEDRKTGIVVRSPKEFSQAIEELESRPAFRKQMASQAALRVRERYRPEKTREIFHSLYASLGLQEKQPVDFRSVFGANPVEWFLSCQKRRSLFHQNDIQYEEMDDLEKYGLYERTKGSVTHYAQYFPEDRQLGTWASFLETQAATISDLAGIRRAT